MSSLHVGVAASPTAAPRACWKWASSPERTLQPTARLSPNPPTQATGVPPAPRIPQKRPTTDAPPPWTPACGATAAEGAALGFVRTRYVPSAKAAIDTPNATVDA